MPLTSYLRLRLTLLARLLREVGAWRLAVVGPLLGLALLQVVHVLGHHPLGRWLLPGLAALGILAKYAFYPVAAHIRTTQGLVLALGLLGVGQPDFPPLLAVVVGGLIWQSRRRLAQQFAE